MLEIPQELLLDVRLIERHIERGLITREQYQKYLDELPDRSEKSTTIKVDLNDVGVGNRKALTNNEQE